ncbi:MAG: MATE family efflux transporter [Halolamina sp.]
MSRSDGLSAYRERWERLTRLGAPVAASSVTRSVMGATDVLIAAAISPSAVAVVTIADLYRQMTGRIGGGIGGGAVALTSQDTGAGAEANRDETVVQAALLCVLVGAVAAIGAGLYGEPAISLVGGGELDDSAVADGAAYLAVTLLVAPVTLMKAVFAQAFAAIGDTKTPFYIGATGDVLNVAASLALGLGFAPLGIPRLGVLGLGIATAGASVIATLLYLLALAKRSPYSYVRPTDPTLAKQVLQVGLPQSAGGFVTSAAMFPFSRIVIGFGTGIYAGYQVAWRLYRLTIGTLVPAIAVATKIIVGQAIGDGDVADARFTVRAALSLGVVVAAVIGLLLAVATEPLAALLVSGEGANRWTVSFARLLGAVAVLGVANNVLTAALQGASETRVGLASRIAGMLGGMVGVTWLVGVELGYGVLGAYAGIVACYLLFVAVSAWGYLFTDWAGRAAGLMVERGSVGESGG